MKQLLQNLRSGETLIAEIPIPKPKPGTALVRTAASLVSSGTERTLVEFAGKSLVGKARSRPELFKQVVDKARREGLLTTVEAAFNRLDQPMPLGYSSAGTIVATGEGLQGFHKGQRVAGAGGGYAVHAEYVVIPQNLMVPLPDNVDFESAAFTTLGAIALHGFRLSKSGLGDRVAVIGLGLLGLLTVGIASAAGCHVLGIDLDPDRVRLGEIMGAVGVHRERAETVASSFSQGRGCDSVLICADSPSSDPVVLAGAIARDRATVIATGAVGLEIPRKIYYEKELSLVVSRSYGPGRYDPSYEEGGQDYPIGYVRWTEGRNLEAFVDLLASGRLDVHPLISHRFPIERAPEAYQLITGKRDERFLGVLLTYGEGNPEVEEKISTGAQDIVQEDRRQGIAQVLPQGKEYDRPDACRLGVLGAGNFPTAVLLPAIRNLPNLELVGIVSASGLSAQQAARRFGFSYADSKEKALLDDPKINTIAVFTRHNLHARQVLRALEAGKHVFCEKPLATEPEQLGEIEAVLNAMGNAASSPEASDSDRSVAHPPASGFPLLMVGFNRRFAPMAVRLRAFFAERREPLIARYRVNAGYLPLTHWLHDPEQGGGRIIGEGCHFVDFLTFLVGQPPDAVSAQGLPDMGRYREDNLVLSFSFPDGSLGSLTYLANGDKALPKERLEVFSAGRVGILDDFRKLELIADGRRQMVRSRLRQDKGHRAEWEAFTKAILAGGPPPIPYEHLIWVTRATFAAVDSLHLGERVTISR